MKECANTCVQIPSIIPKSNWESHIFEYGFPIIPFVVPFVEKFIIYPLNCLCTTQKSGFHVSVDLFLDYIVSLWWMYLS